MSANSDERDRVMRLYPTVTVRVLTDHPAQGGLTLEIFDRRLEDDPTLSAGQDGHRDGGRPAGSDTSVGGRRAVAGTLQGLYT